MRNLFGYLTLILIWLIPIFIIAGITTYKCIKIKEHPSKYELYNMALFNCDKIQKEVERNACRINVSRVYER